LASSLHDPRYARLIELVVDARKEAGLTQRDVAARLKQPPSYIGKIESLQRRLDLIELIDVLEAVGAKPADFLRRALADVRRRA
jgi:transcriptional regulator with XRE-family HTH domain